MPARDYRRKKSDLENSKARNPKINRQKNGSGGIRFNLRRVDYRKRIHTGYQRRESQGACRAVLKYHKRGKKKRTSHVRSGKVNAEESPRKESIWPITKAESLKTPTSGLKYGGKGLSLVRGEGHAFKYPK